MTPTQHDDPILDDHQDDDDLLPGPDFDEVDNDDLVELWSADADPDALVPIPVDTEYGRVWIRQLSRDVVHSITKGKGGASGAEARTLARGVVKPKMTSAQWAAVMKKRKSGDIQTIVDKIVEHSGMEEGARRAARDAFRDEPDS